MADSRPEDGPAEQAAVWYARLAADKDDARQRADFARWRDADPAHARAWAAIERVDQKLSAVGDDPAIAAMLRAARQAPANDSPPPRWWAAAAAAALVASVGGGALFLSHAPDASQAAHRDRYATRIGETRTLTLADGSVLTLDAASAASVRLGDRRQVALERGRAFFKVAKDPTRPFVVTAGTSSVTALGTQFAVALSRSEATVSLTEGSVRVVPSAGGRPVVLRPGDVVTLAGAEARLVHGGAEDATRWRTGELVFDRTPLADVADTLNRYSARKLVLRGDALRRHPFSGVLRTDQGPEALVEALDAYGVARVTQETPGQLVLTAR